MVNLCRTFRTLPREGGLLDQDHDLIEKMKIVVHVQHEFDRIEHQKREAEAKRNANRVGG